MVDEQARLMARTSTTYAIYKKEGNYEDGRAFDSVYYRTMDMTYVLFKYNFEEEYRRRHLNSIVKFEAAYFLLQSWCNTFPADTGSVKRLEEYRRFYRNVVAYDRGEFNRYINGIRERQAAERRRTKPLRDYMPGAFTILIRKYFRPLLKKLAEREAQIHVQTKQTAKVTGTDTLAVHA